ncbi:MAG: putative FmdB family regulatory protein [Lysobacterales bacterium]|jgi:putative FmdB family regulatory protein
MPIYEYRCNDCGHKLERIQKLSDEPLKDCPACEKPELRKQVSAAAFRLKGGGWYETDFKQGDKRNLADSGNEAKASSSPETKTSDSGPEKSKPADSGKVETVKKETKKESKPAKETSSTA